MEIKNNLNKIDPYVQRTGLEKGGTSSKGTESVTASTGSVGDTVSISTADLKAVAVDTALNTSEVRQDKIDGIKAKIADGTYEINSRNIAEKLIQTDREIFGQGE